MNSCTMEIVKWRLFWWKLNSGICLGGLDSFEPHSCCLGYEKNPSSWIESPLYIDTLQSQGSGSSNLNHFHHKSCTILAIPLWGVFACQLSLSSLFHNTRGNWPFHSLCRPHKVDPASFLLLCEHLTTKNSILSELNTDHPSGRSGSPTSEHQLFKFSTFTCILLLSTIFRGAKRKKKKDMKY